jgi:hypothetical protein
MLRSLNQRLREVILERTGTGRVPAFPETEITNNVTEKLN